MNFISIEALQSSGFYEFMLPFLLVTGITYGIFSFVKGKNKDFPLNSLAIAIVSTVIGLFATNNKMLRDFLFKWTPFFIILMIIIFLFLLVQKLFDTQKGDYLPMLILLVLTLAVIGAFGVDNLSRMIGSDADNIVWAIGFLIFILILWGVYKMKDTGAETPKPTKPGTPGV